MIVLVAPYSPPGTSSNPNLGAARKIETIIAALGRIDNNIVLVNTSHDSAESQKISMGPIVLGGKEITEVLPPIYSNRRLGKLRNLIDVDRVLQAVLKLGKPDLVWLYNGYAFEAKFGKMASKKYQIPIFLEFEDWHFSRGRGFNPKPVVDWIYWRLLMPFVTHASAVNSVLAKRVTDAGGTASLLPGVVTREIGELSSLEPFSSGDSHVTVGYFGGLSKEKGADQVLALVGKLPPAYNLVVTGSGELQRDFEQAQLAYPDRIAYHGRVSDQMLTKLIGSCDVLLNPHSSIALMNGGVFPFKIIEGVASGRLMISTKVPSDGLEAVLRGVVFINDDSDALLESVLNAKLLYENSREDVCDGAKEANRRFGQSAIIDMVNIAYRRGSTVNVRRAE